MSRRALRTRRGTYDVGPARGNIARVRHRQYLIEKVVPTAAAGWPHLGSDGVPGRRRARPALEVLWELELGRPGHRARDARPRPGRALDDADAFGAYLHALSGARSPPPTAAVPGAVPRRHPAQIHQLTPLMEALELPRANLFIADDVGLGKTIEAGLVLQELMLRQQADASLVVCPAVGVPAVAATRCSAALRPALRDLRPRRSWRAAAGARLRREPVGHPLALHRLAPACCADRSTREPLLRLARRARAQSLLDPRRGARRGAASASTYAVDTRDHDARSAIWRRASSTGCSCPPRRTTGTRTASPRCWKSSTRSASPAACPSRRQHLEPVMVRRLKRDLRELGVGVSRAPRPAARLDARRAARRAGAARDGGAADTDSARPRRRARLAKMLAGLPRALWRRKKAAARPHQPAEAPALERRGVLRDAEVHALRRAAGRAAPARRPLKRPTTLVGAGDLDDDTEDGLPDEASRGGRCRGRRRRERAGRASRRGRASCSRRCCRSPARTARARREGPRAPRVDPREPVPPGAGRRSEGSRDGSGRIAASSSSPSTRDTKRYLVELLAPPSRTPTRASERIREFHGGMGDDAREEIQRAFNGPPGETRSHPRRDRRRARGRQPPGALRRPLPLRHPVEPRPPRAAQRPHRPHAPARARGALPLLRLPAAAPRTSARDPGAQGRHHRSGAGLPRRGAARGDGKRPDATGITEGTAL